jgi:hypothetical protein
MTPRIALPSGSIFDTASGTYFETRPRTARGAAYLWIPGARTALVLDPHDAIAFRRQFAKGAVDAKCGNLDCAGCYPRLELAEDEGPAGYEDERDDRQFQRAMSRVFRMRDDDSHADAVPLTSTRIDTTDQ